MTHHGDSGGTMSPGRPRGHAGPIERLPTGISGFDDVSMGGLPAGRPTLVTGTTGSEPLPRVAHLLSGSAALTEHPPWPADAETSVPEIASGT